MDTRTLRAASFVWNPLCTGVQDILNGSLNQRRCAGQGRAETSGRGAVPVQGTILEIGISRMSVAPCALSSGIRVFTLVFSTTVSIA